MGKYLLKVETCPSHRCPPCHWLHTGADGPVIPRWTAQLHNQPFDYLLNIAHCTLYLDLEHCTLNLEHWTLYIEHCTLHNCIDYLLNIVHYYRSVVHPLSHGVEYIASTRLVLETVDNWRSTAARLTLMKSWFVHVTRWRSHSRREYRPAVQLHIVDFCIIASN